MAKPTSFWGIDIGQCALKAMRCTRRGDEIVADAVDYIEYPKILSQPDEADPKQLVRDALEQFLSRNDVKGHGVAISVPGQSGLSRFFKPPPVDAKKIPDIVRFEARQQIPFALEEVIWDYQLLAGQEVDGFAVDAEVGLFAMKRDQVFRVIEPFSNADVELDIVQLAPLSIFNFVTYDLLGDKARSFDPDSPPPSVVVLSLGTETTDLVVTNGYRVWQRSIPLGGNHFTKQLTKELKLTFAKAEHLKRNARQAEDPKRVFQAMRPVFNDLVTEVQRSVSYFQNIDRKAKIEGVVVLGNTVKLPGLQQYLAKNLGYEVIHFDEFRRLDESLIKGSPAYKENQLAFGVCYGLCLQGLGAAKLNTNLIPRELLTDRLIRAKKPWAVASVAALLLACSFNFFFNYNAWYEVHEEQTYNGVSWKQAEAAVQQVQSLSNDYKNKDKERLDKKALLERIGNEVVGNTDRRILWLELMTAINLGLPRTPNVDPSVVPDPKTLPFDQRQELNIEKIETQYFTDLSEWYTAEAQRRYQNTQRELGLTSSDGAAGGGAGQGGAGSASASGAFGASGGNAGGGAASGNEPPSGEGWVIELVGHHFYNGNRETYGPVHLYNTLIRHLELGVVPLPNPRRDGQYSVFDEVVPFTMKELGISHPLIAEESQPYDFKIQNPNYVAAGGGAGLPMGGAAGLGGIGGVGGLGGAPPGGLGGAGLAPGIAGAGNSGTDSAASDEPPQFSVKKYDFRIQFVWRPVLLADRLQAKLDLMRQQAEQEAQQAAAAAAEGEQEPGAMGVAPGGPAGPAAGAPGPAAPAANPPVNAPGPQPSGAPGGVAPAQPGAPAAPAVPAAQAEPPMLDEAIPEPAAGELPEIPEDLPE